ncbi:FAD-dependent oxidoreductase NDAI_0C06370 [Naumovozyma dairenensis CBS 421]|uniref:FAD dependent oxidoreductase domain-containing protein n=1 Tax=Naumovozyma dairenensis (strain ATCC 10597 / BCRC 20456 / CBS 421 / NBRC 0211 / NRRL Y-12639) TaxID=1071378 RepID=G0W935_NAUDC|nr:hypothetical protein NDAI_0C06370 [Naumovozyma dairenensis CBS 421]CCD24296.1 hypothetical protein NDAI_0C06370 [Naumovozyma dairenensis CBS 421]
MTNNAVNNYRYDNMKNLDAFEDNVCIVGAGVIGLTIGYQLLSKLSETTTNDKNKKKFKLKQLTIIASNFPKDSPISHHYTSPWAGAHFRPFPHRPETFQQDQRESNYTRITYGFFQELVKNHPESTIEFMKGVDWLENPPLEYSKFGPGYCNTPTSKLEFKPIPKDQLPRGVTFGAEYLTYCLNAPKYLLFLQNQMESIAKKLGIKIEWIRPDDPLKSLKELREKYLLPMSLDTNVIFNATGQGLQYINDCNSTIMYDPKSYPIRGQTLLLNVPNPNHIKFAKKTITHQSADGLWTFVIKRPSNDPEMEAPQYILGGTKQPNVNDVDISEGDTKALLERARVLFPELLFPNDEFDIVKVNVGLRPAREGGSRIVLETIPTHDGSSNLKICHAYGLGGMGYETSIGVARHALSLIS